MTDDRIFAKARELHQSAVEAGYKDPILGALMIAATALVGLEDEMSDGRHPKGRASGGE